MAKRRIASIVVVALASVWLAAPNPSAAAGEVTEGVAVETAVEAGTDTSVARHACGAKAVAPLPCGTDCVSGTGVVQCFPAGPVFIDVSVVQLKTDGTFAVVASESNSGTGLGTSATAVGRTCESEGLLTRTPLFFTVVSGTHGSFDVAGPTPLDCGA